MYVITSLDVTGDDQDYLMSAHEDLNEAKTVAELDWRSYDNDEDVKWAESEGVWYLVLMDGYYEGASCYKIEELTSPE